MTDNSRQALVGHIGGTFISLAIADIDELSIANFALLSSADFTTPMDAIERYLRSVPRCPDKVGLAIAGTVEADTARLTYHPWTIERTEVARLTGAGHVVLVPDLEAVARALPHLSDYDLVELRPGSAADAAPKSLIAVGTGLSLAALLPVAGGWDVVPASGGAMSLPLAAGDELELRRSISPDALPTAEEVLSGDGMVALYRALAARAGSDYRNANPPRIIRSAESGDDPAASETLARFVGWLGRFAGDIALVHGAAGGVYLGGVIPPSIAPLLAGAHFRSAFEGCGTRQRQLSSVPVYAIKTAGDAGLRGAAIAVARGLVAEERPRSGPLRETG